MSNLIKSDAAYKEWIQNVSQRFRLSQIRAAVKVNDEMLRFYWYLGKDIATMSLDARYGSGFYKAISDDLHDIFPDIHSFSITNLKYMRYFYELYPGASNRPQLGDDSGDGQNRPQLGDDSRLDVPRSDLFSKLGKEAIFYIPWGHQKLLIDKCKGEEEKALFYVHKILENNWSRAVLMNFLDMDLFERQGKAVSNFALTLPAPQSDLAQAITKDPYNFDFLTIREKYDEKELKDAMMANAEKFLLELGSGFALLGREVRLIVGSKEKFIDLLFYHAKIHCYIVVEVKATDFDAEFAGQLGTYVVAVNHQLKAEHDNPTIGLLICKNMDRVEAQYAMESSSQPLGVSTYQLSKLVPEEFRSSLPTIEEIEAELSSTDE